jgi:hypothetical protein
LVTCNQPDVTATARALERPKAVAAATRIFLDEIEKLLGDDRLRCEEKATPPSPRPRLAAA